MQTTLRSVSHVSSAVLVKLGVLIGVVGFVGAVHEQMVAGYDMTAVVISAGGFALALVGIVAGAWAASAQDRDDLARALWVRAEFKKRHGITPRHWARSMRGCPNILAVMHAECAELHREWMARRR